MLGSFCLSASAPWGATSVASQAPAADTAGTAQRQLPQRAGSATAESSRAALGPFPVVVSFWGLIGGHGKLTFLKNLPEWFDIFFTLFST